MTEARAMAKSQKAARQAKQCVRYQRLCFFVSAVAAAVCIISGTSLVLQFMEAQALSPVSAGWLCMGAANVLIWSLSYRTSKHSEQMFKHYAAEWLAVAVTADYWNNLEASARQTTAAEPAERN